MSGSIALGSGFFHWHENQGVLDLTDLPEAFAPTGGLWSTIYVRSNKTGVVKAFSEPYELFDREGELFGWKYSTDDNDFTLIIFND